MEDGKYQGEVDEKSVKRLKSFNNKQIILDNMSHASSVKFEVLTIFENNFIVFKEKNIRNFSFGNFIMNLPEKKP